MDGLVDHTPGKSQQGMNATSHLVAPRQHLDPWAKIQTFWVWSPNIQGQGTGFPKLVSLLLQHCSARPLWRIHKSSSPRSMSYLSPIFVLKKKKKKKKENTGKEKESTTTQSAKRSPRRSFHTAAVTLLSMQPKPKHPCYLTYAHFSQTPPSMAKQVGKTLQTISLVGLYPQINKGNSIPLIRLQATEDLQKLNPDTVLNLSFYI